MVANIKAIEVTGEIDGNGQLHLDEALPVIGPNRVRVILLLENSDDLSEQQWLRALSNNPDLEFLKQAQEDVYTLADGKPFND